MVDNVIANGVSMAQTCPAVGYQSASVCVPVTVTLLPRLGPRLPSAVVLL